MKPLFFLSLLLIVPMLLVAQSSSGYCYNKGTRGNVWLQKVSIGKWVSNTGGNSGYLYQPDSKLVLNADTNYMVQLDLGGYPRVQDSIYWHIWIDFNRDMDFEDEGEQVFQNKTVYKGQSKGTLKLPRLFESEQYMLRIVVAKSRFSPSCGESTMIEMEDYLTTISPVFRCKTPLSGNIQVEKITDRQAVLAAKDLSASKYKWHIESEDGRFSKDTTQTEAIPIVLAGLSAKTKYKVRLKLECAEGESRWSEDVEFTTLPKILCPVLDKNKIQMIQRSWSRAELNYAEVIDSQLEWQYRIKGTAAWVPYTYTAIQIPQEGASIEVQIRYYCIDQNSWTDWSESTSFELSPCFFPELKDIVVVTSMTLYPNLNASIHFANGSYDPYIFKWYHREKDTQVWIDTIKEQENSISIHNLSPGKAYELRVDIHCGKDSLSIYRTVQVSPLCQSLQASQIDVVEVYDTFIRVRANLSELRTLEYRYREEGATEFSIAQLSKGILSGLKPNTTYEISVRVVCEDSIPDWSASVFFTTTNCKLPQRGELDVVQSYLPDSIRFAAQFFSFTEAENFTYHWRYRVANTQDWQNLEVQAEKKEVLLKNLTPGTKYDLQMSVNCLGNPLDSFALATSFTAAADACAPKPDTSLLSLKFQDKTFHLIISVKAPKGYSYQIRNKSENTPYYTSYFPAFQDLYLINITLYSGINDLQFRFICPNGNISPWSDVIKIQNLKGFAETDLPQQSIEKAPQLLQTNTTPQVRIAPNPSSGHFSILFPAEMEPYEANLEILSTTGQRIYSLKTAIDPAQTLPLDLRQQAPGLYILRIQAGSKVYTERIIIGSNR